MRVAAKEGGAEMSDRTNERPGIDSGAAALWASAMVILALIVVQAGRMGGQAAHADVAWVGDVTILTTASAENEDVLAVLDRREELIYMYGIESGRNVQLFQVENIGNMFVQARGGVEPRR